MIESIKAAFAYYPIAEVIAFVILFYGPQWARILRRRSSDDVSAVSYVANIAANAGFVVYGLWYATASYVASCVVGVACSTVTVVLIALFRSKPRAVGVAQSGGHVMSAYAMAERSRTGKKAGDHVGNWPRIGRESQDRRREL